MCPQIGSNEVGPYFFQLYLVNWNRKNVKFFFFHGEIFFLYTRFESHLKIPAERLPHIFSVWERNIS